MATLSIVLLQLCIVSAAEVASVGQLFQELLSLIHLVVRIFDISDVVRKLWWLNHREIRIHIVGSAVTLLRVRSLLGIGILDLRKWCQRLLLLIEHICIIVLGRSAHRLQVPPIEALNFAHGALG